MARSSIGSGIPSRGENYNHFGALRLRVVGEGSLEIKALGMADTVLKTMRSLEMDPTTDYEPNRLMNITKQRISFEFRVNEIYEWFSINRIIVYQRVIYTQGDSGRSR